MADLTVEFCGVKFKNPLIAASSELTLSPENMKRVIDAGAGGLVAKTLTDSLAMRKLTGMSKWRYLNERHEPARGKVPRSFTFYGRSGLAEEGPEEWVEILEEVGKYADDHGSVLIGSAGGTTVEAWAELARNLEGAGVKLIELNFGCPHPSQMEGVKTGMLVGQDKDLAAEVTHAVKKAVKVPVMVKLTPQVADVVEVAQAVREAGADAVTLTNRFVGFCIDVETARPLIFGSAGAGGPWVKPLTLRWVSKTYTALDVPISGSNGAYDAKDVVEFMMAGATTVQMCSAIMLEGYQHITWVVHELEAFLDRKGYRGAGDIVGLASKAAVSYAAMAELPKQRAVVSRELCVDCERCIASCFYNSIVMVEGETSTTDSCRGCGICTTVCPVEGAIALVPAL